MSLSETLGSDFPRRCIVTNLAAGAICSLFAMQYLGVGSGSGFALGVLLGTFHLYLWIGLGKQILGPREGHKIALYVFLKLAVVYGGTLAYLIYDRKYAASFLIGFSLIFFVILQKVLGRKLIATKTLRSVP